MGVCQSNQSDTVSTLYDEGADETVEAPVGSAKQALAAAAQQAAGHTPSFRHCRCRLRAGAHVEVLSFTPPAISTVGEAKLWVVEHSSYEQRDLVTAEHVSFELRGDTLADEQTLFDIVRALEADGAHGSLEEEEPELAVTVMHKAVISRHANSRIREAVGMYFDPNTKDKAIVVYGEIGDWDLQNVTDLRGLFEGRTAFNESLARWKTLDATSMESMFCDATAFNQPIEEWDVSQVTSFSNMFSGASVFNQPLQKWSTHSVVTISSMFHDATSFNQPLEAWDMRNCENMAWFLSGASSFDQPLENWNTSKVVPRMAQSSFCAGASALKKPPSWLKQAHKCPTKATSISELASLSPQPRCS